MNVVFTINYYSTQEGVDAVSTLSQVYRSMENAAEKMQELNEHPDNLNEDGTFKNVYFVSMVRYND